MESKFQPWWLFFACVNLASSVGYGGNITTSRVHRADRSRVTGVNLIEMLTDDNDDDNVPKSLRLRSGRITEIPLLLETHRMKLRVKSALRSHFSSRGVS